MSRSSRRIAAIVAGIAATLLVVGVVFVALFMKPTPPAVSEKVAEAYASGGALAAATEAPEVPIATFIGDSYTQGNGASSQDTKWTTLVARQLGWDELNLGKGGTGYLATASRQGCGLHYCPSYPEMIPQAAGPKVQTVFVSGGYNDFKAYAADPAPVDEAINKTYAMLRGEMPTAKIIAVGPSSPGTVTESIRAMDATVQAAAASVGAQYISLIEPNIITKEMLTEDGVHVNDAGHKAIADRVAAALTAG